jgi:DNA repair exonuclease SbcCD ATPase subunit
LDEERQESHRRFDQAKEDWYRERATLRQSVDDARKQLSEDNEKNARLADHWMLQLDDARQQVRELKERHQEDKQRWEADIKLERARADRLAGTVSNYEQRIEEREKEVEILNARLVEMEQLNSSQAQTITSLEHLIADWDVDNKPFKS